MMKKTLVLASLLAFTTTTALANADMPCPMANKANKPPIEGKFQPPPPNPEKMAEKRAEFEKKLKLTEEQKAQAKEIRMKGHEAMKPIMEQMKAKKAEFDTVMKDGSITVDEQRQKIAQLHEEMKVLKKQAKELRIKNMQEFESILTEKQKKTLAKMKEEGRKNFKKNHPKRPPCKKCNCSEK
ncbi:Spy/CpxP family protein refolding chaperone [bacterium]|nr:Spy/CpxP family protein refolding chaperone [bacterium]